MSRYTFRVRNKGRQAGLGVSAFYGEVGWDDELATFYARVWREAPEEPLTPADYEPLVSCGGRLCEVTDVAKLERCLAERNEVDFDPAEIVGHWDQRLEADRDRFMESLSMEQEMNLLFRLRLATDP